MPSIETLAVGSDACQVTVVDPPLHALLSDVEIVSDGREHDPGILTARCRDDSFGGGFGLDGGVKSRSSTG